MDTTHIYTCTTPVHADAVEMSKIKNEVKNLGGFPIDDGFSFYSSTILSAKYFIRMILLRLIDLNICDSIK